MRLSQDEQKKMLARELVARRKVAADAALAVDTTEGASAPAPDSSAPVLGWLAGVPDSRKYESRPSNKECLFLTKLTPDIRSKIYQYLLVPKPIVVPTYVRYKLSTRYNGRSVTIYGYQFNGNRQKGFEESTLPHFDGSAQKVQISWPSNATPEQLRLINDKTFTVSEDGEWSLPSTFDAELGAEVEHIVHRRGDLTQIINRAIISTHGICGVNLLRTCKMIHKETAKVLYGENTFGFDTRGQEPFNHPRGIHEHDAFHHMANFIPGRPKADGTPQHWSQATWAVAKMFDKSAPKPRFITKDPLTNWLRIIGPVNASHITKVKIDGFFKTARKSEEEKYNRPIGLGRLLKVHAAVLRNACPNLTKLILQRGVDDQLWDDDLDQMSGKLDEDKVDDIVGQVVYTLTQIKELQLGWYQSVVGDLQGNGEWNKALRWTAVVAKRAADREKTKRLRKERAKANRTAKNGQNGSEYMAKGNQGQMPALSQARVNNSFAAALDTAVATAGLDEVSAAAPRASFKKGKKMGLKVAF